VLRVLTFSWDPDKAESNRKKHAITFPEAATAFGDPLSLTILDPVHSEEEARFVLVELTFQDRLVVVAHTETDDEIRIISAPPATRAERQSYEQE
jgi:uncharacterized DUF497 family protein